MRKNLLLLLLLFSLLSGTAFALTLLQGYTAILTSSGAVSGVPPYSYQWFSECPTCGSFTSVSGATGVAYFFDTNSLTQTGTWQFEIQGKDSAANVVNSLAPSVLLKSSTALSIKLGFTAILTSHGGSGGVLPYTYQWFSECPTCGSFSSVAGAEATTYFFDTNTLTQLGQWEFQLQGKDSAANVVNSIANINVIVTNSVALTIQQGYTAILTSPGGSGGILPYNYQWFSECPTCAAFNSIAGATSTTYFFDTNTLTQTGTWQFQLQGKDSAANVVNSISNTNVILTALSCIPVISSNSIAFSSVSAGLFSSTSSSESVTNGGTADANVLVDGGNWVSGGYSFLVGNTLWSAASGGNIGTQLSNTALDTKILVPSSASNTVYFGLNVPTSQITGAYAQTINVLLAC